jgi:hypothetical protein
MIHDMRRTLRTNLTKHNLCSVEIAERVIGHIRKSSIVAVYDKHSYLPEVRTALARYERWLLGETKPERKVVAIKSMLKTKF